MTDIADDLKLTLENFPLERYEPLGLLGRGGLGEVYLARDRKLGKTVAVKCLMMVDDEQIVIFHREAKIASRLHNANIVETLDFGTTEGGRPYIAFEYFKGISLEHLIADRGGRLDEKLVRKLFIIVATALSYIHDHNVFHRDLKPSNILLSEEGSELVVKIIDFGVSAIKEEIQNKTLVQGKTIVGTPVYMSPDPVRGDNFDARSEVYSIGCIMFECLTGEPPFDAPTTAEVLDLHMFNEPPLMVDMNPDVKASPEMQEIISKCIEKDKAARYQNMTELIEALEKPYQSASPEVELEPAAPEQKFGRTQLAITLGALALLLIAGIAAVTIMQNSKNSKGVLAEKSKEDLKDLTRTSQGGLKAKLADDDHEPDAVVDKSTGAYISGRQGSKKLAAIAAAHAKKEIVTLNSQKVTDKMIDDVASLHPKQVQFFTCEIPSSALRKINTIKSMQLLTFHACNGITADAYVTLKELPILSSISIIGCNVTDAELAGLSQLKQVEKMVLDGNDAITLKGIRKLARKDRPLAVWLNEGSATKATPQELQELREKFNILLSTRLDHHEGEGGDGLIHTDALELIE